jgi:PIN domain nuclease of toxin-antitoxin system
MDPSITINTWIKSNWFNPLILVQSCNLPAYPHKDAADRMIIASSRAINSYLMTADQEIIDYANKGYLKVLPINT